MPRRAANLRFVLTTLLASLFVVSMFHSAHTQEPVPPEAVKAGYLRNFAKYVTWPETAFPDKQAPFVIGVLGQDPFEQILDRIVEGKKIRGRPFGVRRFPVVDGQLPSREALSEIHVLFVSSSESDQLPEIVALLRGTNVMAVSDVKSFAEVGGVAELALVGSNIRPRINRRAAKAAGLQISARLLRVAILVEPKR